MMRFLFTISSAVLFVSCSGSFDKSYCARITRIQFPDKYEVLETFDNSEWLTGTVLKVDSVSLKEFVKTSRLKAVSDPHDMKFLSNSYLKNYPADFEKMETVYFRSESVNKNNWNCIADISDEKLWIEISYPDFGGK